MAIHPLVRKGLCLAAVLACFGVVGCNTKNVHLKHSVVPVLPNISKGTNTNRFRLNFAVLNPRNKDYPPNTFHVRAETWYSTTQQSAPCHKIHIIPITGQLEAKTGKFIVSEFEFDDPAYLGAPCTCRLNQCEGGLTLTLRYQGGQKANQQVAGDNTKLHITWKKSGDVADMTIEEQ